MPLAETITRSDTVYNFSENPLKFEIVKDIPSKYTAQIENAVRDFMVSSHLGEGISPEGFLQQTLQSISNATFLNGVGDFWLMTEKDRVLAYVLAHITRDIDNTLTYWASQAWVHRDRRGDISIPMAWQKIRERAKACFCKHIVVVSSRGSEAYCRWLGKGWHEYARLLKEDL